MSHYVLIAVPRKDGSLEELMERYNENREVDPYDEQCSCVYAAHRGAVEAALDEKFGSDYIDNKRKEAPEDCSDEQWQEMIAPYRSERKRLLALPHPPADPKCHDCGGSGLRKTTYNPESKWDWFEIGGRWDGEFGGKNESTVGEIIACGRIPHAIVTPAGWFERGKMGWFGVVRDGIERDEWESQARQILASLDPGSKAYVIDCHI